MYTFTESRFEGLDEEQMEIMKKMGFATFDSTKVSFFYNKLSMLNKMAFAT